MKNRSPQVSQLSQRGAADLRAKLSRRTVLRAAGISLGLPLFESFFTDRAQAAGALQPRFIALYKPNRSAPGTYRFNSLSSLPQALQPLNGIKNECTFIQGMTSTVGEALFGQSGDGHAVYISTFLTGGPMTISNTIVNVGTRSLDQMIADARGSKALTLARNVEYTEPEVFNGDYYDNLSWKSPLPDVKIKTPQAAFDAIFGSGTTVTPSQVNNNFKKSILDYLKEQIAAQTTSVGKSDKIKLDQYLTSVREIEQSINQTETPTMTCGASGLKPAVSSDFIVNTQLMIDLMVKAVECGRHDAITLMMDEEVGTAYRDHHTITHNGPDSTLIEIDQWYVQQFANLVTKLHAIPEGTGTLLTNSLVLYGSGSGQGGPGYHGGGDIPLILAGRASGKVTPGRIITPSGVTHCNLLLTLAKLYGLSATKFGDSTGILTEL